MNNENIIEHESDSCFVTCAGKGFRDLRGLKTSISFSAPRLIWLLQICILLGAMGASHPVLAQAVIDSDSTYNTIVKTYFSNNGTYFHNPTINTKSGLEFPRVGGDGYVFGAGFWIGARFVDEFDFRRTRVLKTYNPISGESMCVPGSYKDGNRFRPDLREQYTVKHEENIDHEVLSSTFHDGDLRAYPGHIDTNSYRVLGMPLGFEFKQRIKAWSNIDLANCVTVETTVRYIGEKALDSVYFCSVADIAIGQSENAMYADTGDFCVIEDKDGSYPFIVSSSDPEGARRFGTLGIGLVSVDPVRKVDGIQIIRADMVDDGNLHSVNYAFMSGGILDDPLPHGDKVVLLSVLIGDVVKGDSFKITVGYVVAPQDVLEPTGEIRNKLNQLRDQLTTIDERQEQSNQSRVYSQIVQGNMLYLPSEFAELTRVTLISTLAERYEVEARQGAVELTGLPPGFYVIVDSKQQTQLLMKLIIIR